VYKGFDVGTAKPSAAEQAEVPHHLLDVADPADGFSAVIFQKLAKQAIEDITARGKLPILVGGTGLYIDSVLYDYGFLPPSDPALREELNALDLPAILARAQDMGLDMTGIDLGNKRRVIRLIENNGERPTMLELRENTLILGLETPREQLLQKIQRRVDVMLTAGLEDEARALAEQYGWGAEPMKGIGYKEWRERFTAHGSLADTRQKIIKHSLDLAKRQRTWFKRNKSIQWLTTEDKLAEAVDFTTTFLNK
jgi:tRNA dimethylallyltransferase